MQERALHRRLTSLPHNVLQAFRHFRKAAAAAVLTLMLAAWFAVFCEECLTWFSSASAEMTCCPGGHPGSAPAPESELSTCGGALDSPCPMYKALESEAVVAVMDSHFPELFKTALFALVLLLSWRLIPSGAPPTTVLRQAAVSFYDPRQLIRIRLLRI